MMVVPLSGSAETCDLLRADARRFFSHFSVLDHQNNLLFDLQVVSASFVWSLLRLSSVPGDLLDRLGTRLDPNS